MLLMGMYNKLVRDKIPNIIKANGEDAIVEVLDDEQYKKELDKKILEEVNEYLDSDEIEELADVLEVMYAILDYKKTTMKELECIREIKREKRGAFKEKLYLIGAKEQKNC